MKVQNLENLVLYLEFSYRLSCEHGCVQVHIHVPVALLIGYLLLRLVGSRYPYRCFPMVSSSAGST
jgi:hypothetical protein